MLQNKLITQKIREEIKLKRAELSEEEKEKKSWFASQFVIHSKIFQESKTVACYLAVDGEMDPSFIIETCQKEKKKCYLPVIDEKEKGKMVFILYCPGDELVINRFDIEEPIYNKNKIIDPKALDLVIMPLTVFYMNGHRLGMGGGYYDRAFAFAKNKHANEKPFLCGFAYSFQEVSSLQTAEWDIAMDAIATEERLTYLE